MKKRLLALVVAFVMILSFGLVACKKDDEGTPVKSVTSVTVAGGAATASLPASGDLVTAAFTATVAGENLVEADKTVTWKVLKGATGTTAALATEATIATTGVLTVKAGQHATYRVVATSVFDTTKSGEKTIVVSAYTAPAPVWAVNFTTDAVMPTQIIGTGLVPTIATVTKDSTAQTFGTGFTYEWTTSDETIAWFWQPQKVGEAGRSADIKNGRAIYVEKDGTVDLILTIKDADGDVVKTVTVEDVECKYTAKSLMELRDTLVTTGDLTFAQAANYGHNGVAFADVWVDDAGKIVDIHLDEIEWNFFNVSLWGEHEVATTDIIEWKALTDATSTTNWAKHIEIGGIKFTLTHIKGTGAPAQAGPPAVPADPNVYQYVSDEKLTFNATLEMGVSAEGITLKGGYVVDATGEFITLPAAANNAASAQWTNEIALHVCNALRTGEYDILKANGEGYEISFLRPCSYGSNQAIPEAPHVCGAESNVYDCEQGNLGAGEFIGVSFDGIEDKDKLFVKRFFYQGRNESGDDRTRPHHALGQALTYDANIAAMVYWVLVTMDGIVPADYESRVRAPGTSLWTYDGVDTGATFNDWDWYMVAIKTAAEATDIEPEAPATTTETVDAVDAYWTGRGVTKAAGFEIVFETETGIIVSVTFDRTGAEGTTITSDGGAVWGYGVERYDERISEIEAALVGKTLEEVAAFVFAQSGDQNSPALNSANINTVLDTEIATSSTAGGSLGNALTHLIEWARVETGWVAPVVPTTHEIELTDNEGLVLAYEVATEIVEGDTVEITVDGEAFDLETVETVLVNGVEAEFAFEDDVLSFEVTAEMLEDAEGEFEITLCANETEHAGECEDDIIITLTVEDAE